MVTNLKPHADVESQWQETQDFLRSEVIEARRLVERHDTDANQVLYRRRLDEEAQAVRRWEAYHDHPTIQKMSQVMVQRCILYRSDFYYHDIKMLEASPDTLFYWVVRQTGTWLIRVSCPDDEGYQNSRMLFDYEIQSEDRWWYQVTFHHGIRRVSDPAKLKRPSLESVMGGMNHA